MKNVVGEKVGERENEKERERKYSVTVESVWFCVVQIQRI